MELTATDGGLHAVVMFPAAGAATEQDVVDRLAEAGVRVAPLTSYGVPGASTDLPAGIVFGYGGPSTVVLMDAVQTMIRLLTRRDDPRD